MSIWLRKFLTCGLGASLLALSGGGLWKSGLPSSAARSTDPLHYTVNIRTDFFAAAAVGFNLADVSSQFALDALPPGMEGVYWVGNGYKRECSWKIPDDQLTIIVEAIKDHPKFSGMYFIADTPHPSVCPDGPERIAERTALIHSLDPMAKTFIVVVEGWHYPGEFAQLKDAADYIGVDPYPCNVTNAESGCSWDKLRTRVANAIAGGIAVNRIVPVFQAFGQDCTEAKKPYYRLPTIAETRTLLALWDELIPAAQRPFDMTYSWGSQPLHSCPSLQMANGDAYPDLQSVYARYFAEMGH